MENTKNTHIDVNNKTLFKQLLKLAIPIVLSGAVQTGYQLINTFWVGRLGSEAVAVISICMPVNILLISLGSGLSLAGSILAAQYFGAGNLQRVNHVAAQTLLAMVLLSVLLTLMGFIVAPFILQVLGVNSTIFAAALRYLRISFLGMVFLFLNAMYQAIFRSIGEVKTPLRIITVGVVLNSMLDPLLIFGWHSVPALGVNGAAYATLITQIVTAFIGIRLMLSSRFRLTIRAADFWPEWPFIGRLIRLGFPASLEQSMQALTVSAMIVLVSKFGTTALAAYGIAFRILTFLIILPFGISMATSILVGQSIGSGRQAQSRDIATLSVKLSFAIMAVVGILIFSTAKFIVAFFVPHDAQLIEHTAFVLQIFAVSFPLNGVQLSLTGAFRGAGATFSAMLITLFCAWVVQLPLAFLLSHYTQLSEWGLWWASPVAAVINILIALIYFKTSHWNKGTIEQAQPAHSQYLR